MENIYKWWIVLEVYKIIILIVSTTMHLSNGLKGLLAVILIIFTVVGGVWSWGRIKWLSKIIPCVEDFCFRRFLERARILLVSIIVLDFMPFFPIIQGVLRHLYYRRFRTITKKDNFLLMNENINSM